MAASPNLFVPNCSVTIRSMWTDHNNGWTRDLDIVWMYMPDYWQGIQCRAELNRLFLFRSIGFLLQSLRLCSQVMDLAMETWRVSTRGSIEEIQGWHLDIYQGFAADVLADPDEDLCHSIGLIHMWLIHRFSDSIHAHSSHGWCFLLYR